MHHFIHTCYTSTTCPSRSDTWALKMLPAAVCTRPRRRANCRSWSYFTTDSESVSLGVEDPCGTCDQILLPVGMLLSEICGLVSVGRPLWWEDRSAICSVITQWSCGTCDQILLSVGMLLSEICGLVSVGHPLWREDGSAICSVITQWSESRRTRNHTSLSHLILPQEQGGPVTSPCTGLPLRRLLRLAGLKRLPRISLLMSWGGPNIKPARNNVCVIPIAGYHGNSVYRVVASIPVWLTVTSLAMFYEYSPFCEQRFELGASEYES
jgi:hypothetical protein